MGKKQALLAELREKPDLMRTTAKVAEFHRIMAQEQKYIDRVEGAASLLRRQEGLPPDESTGLATPSARMPTATAS